MATENLRLIEQGERLKQLRRPIAGTGGDGKRTQYEITQATAAAAAAVEPRTYQAYEGGGSDMGHEVARKLADFFGVTVAYLREGETGPSQLDRLERTLEALTAKVDAVHVETLREDLDTAKLIRDVQDQVARTTEIIGLVSDRLDMALQLIPLAARGPESTAGDVLDTNARPTPQPDSESSQGDERSG